MRTVVVALSLVVGSTLGPSDARAQETGGSFGGSDWGDEPSGGGGSDWGGGGGGGSDFGGGGSDWGGGGGGGGSDWGGGGSDFGGGGGGGRDWGSGSGSSGRSWGSSAGSGGGSYGGSGGSYGRSGSGSSASPWVFRGFLIVILVGLVISWWLLRLYSQHRAARLLTLDRDLQTFRAGLLRDRAPIVRAWPETGLLRAPRVTGVDVSAISLAIDWRERKRLQARLEQLAKSGRTGTTGGLAALLHETVVELRRVQHAWLYAGAVNAAPASKQEARATFTRVAQDMRSRFRRELVRSADGITTTDEAPELRAKELEGPGVVVVTVVVAARGNIPDVANARDGEHLRMLMRALGAIDAATLVALEVIWSPAAENDRMSTVELEALYPELHPIDAASLGGRVFCAYCGFPHPAELLRCPECGAPTPAATVA